jgi:hypothetical protein
MSLTFRGVKGSALTIEELDSNFAYFTGSHSITGSLTISGSTSATISPLILQNIPAYSDNTTALAAGLAVGSLYRNGDFLLIVH